MWDPTEAMLVLRHRHRKPIYPLAIFQLRERLEDL
jgi:hypothetical protein